MTTTPKQAFARPPLARYPGRGQAEGRLPKQEDIKLEGKRPPHVSCLHVFKSARPHARGGRWLALLLIALLCLPGCNRDEIAMGDPEYARQLTDGGDAHRGRERIMNYGCAGCHTIPGIPDADASVGPPLDRMAHRMYVAGVTKNTPRNLIAWIQDPPAVDDKTAMPNLHVTPDDAKDIASYLYTLR